jgi:hypothetical protein
MSNDEDKQEKKDISNSQGDIDTFTVNRHERGYTPNDEQDALPNPPPGGSGETDNKDDK